METGGGKETVLQAEVCSKDTAGLGQDTGGQRRFVRLRWTVVVVQRRWRARKEGRRYCDPVALTYQVCL